jgi:hypothetical protein
MPGTVSRRVAVDLRLAPAHSTRLEVQAIVRSTWEPSTPTAHRSAADSDLPRKEVIQPHLPVRLPCYDFVPITDPTFDGCLPCGLAHRLRVLPAFMT